MEPRTEPSRVFISLSDSSCRGRNNRPPTLAEADRHEALAAGAGAQEHLVAVLKKAPLLSRLEAHRPLPTLSRFEQAPAAGLVRRRDRARAEQIARPQIAA